MKLFNLKKDRKVQILPSIYHSVEGKPFKIEEIGENANLTKIEFYYLEQSKFFTPLIESRQFVLYTADRGSYRVLIDKEYYNQFQILYDKDVNAVWINFMNSLYKQQLIFQKKYIWYISITLLIGLISSIFFLTREGAELNKTYVFLICLSILGPIIGSILITKRQEKYFILLKNNQLEQTIEKIQNIIGKEVYEGILQKQKDYQYKPFINKNNNDKIDSNEKNSENKKND